MDRGIYSSTKVEDGSAFMWQDVLHDHDLTRLPELRRAARLDALSPALPELIVGAYSNLSREHIPEAIIDSWVVTEQILDAYWEQHVSGATEAGRAAMLKDSRTFTAAIRAEILLTAGQLSPELWQAITPRARTPQQACASRPGHAASRSRNRRRDARRSGSMAW